jgi:macrolide transport system ATP-binding/permease protein
METLLQDFRYSLRAMAKNPSFVAAAVASLALAIGPNTVIFSLVNALLLKPLPVDAPDQVVRVFSSDDHGPYHPLSYPDYIDYRDRQRDFSGLAACQRIMMSLNNNGRPEVVPGAVVSANFFSVLGAQPLLGRAFAPEEDQSPGARPVAVVSFNLWQRRFNADPALLGAALRLNGHSFTVIGVAAKGFTGINVGLTTDIWVPITMYPKLMPSLTGASDPLNDREQAWLNDVIGRLKPGVGIEQAQSSLNGVSKQLESAYPSRAGNQRRGLALVPISKGHPKIRAAILSFAVLLMAVVGIVLLIACANVANLLLTRGAARQREIAIRLALGANRWRLTRQLLTESVTLSLAGGAAGVLLAYWVSDLLLTFKPAVSIPMTIDLSLDRRVFGFSLAISFLTGIAFGMVPALQASRPDLIAALKAKTVSFGRGDRASHLHSLLVIVQMSLSLVLLIGAALLFRSMQNAYRTDPGFEKNNLLLLSTDLDLRGYTAAEGRKFCRRFIDRMRSLPGLQAASLTSVFPLSLASSEIAVTVEGRGLQSGRDGSLVSASNVAPGYFKTMNIPLIQGREFSDHDAENGPGVVIINQAMARRFWPGEDPIGKRINLDPLAPQISYHEVIGVAKDSKFLTLGESPEPFVYKCIFQQYSSGITLVVRTAPGPERMLSAIRREVQALDEDLPIFDVKTVTEHMDISLTPLRMATTLLGILGGLALLLASVGLYAVVAYSVTLRTREFGIRMAIGARSVQVLKSVLARGTVLATIGMAIGLALALAMARAMSNLGLLYGIGATDPATFIGMSLLLVSVALLASYFPARRAMKVDPVTTLRQE